MSGKESDFIAAALHASNSGGRSLASLRLLHDALNWSLGNVAIPETDGARSRDPGKIVWEYLSYLRLPRVVWGIGDVFDFAPPKGFTRHILLLPTNSNLDTSAALVKHAHARYGSGPFDELKANRPARLGQSFRTSAGNSHAIGGICHLVCRSPGEPALRNLEECLRSIAAAPLQRHVLPLWGSADEIPQWVEAIAGWVNRQHSIQDAGPSVLIRVLPEDQKKAEHLESGLIYNGVLVGRETECHFYDPNYDIFFVDDSGSLPNQKTVKERLAVEVRSRGPLTPDLYAEWMFSGTSLPEEAWERHLRIVRGPGDGK